MEKQTSYHALSLRLHELLEQRLNVSNNLTVDSMNEMFKSLKDLTGSSSKTLSLGSTNLAKLTDDQKAVATSKNWILN